MNNSCITMNHGSGGGRSRELVEKIFKKHFSNPVLDRMDDSGVLEIQGRRLAVTTDSFVVKPIFFEGGNIGKLAVCGTVNDLAVMGAKPIALTAGFILEEGLEIDILEGIVKTMSQMAKEAGVSIAAGDTKVVERGNADRIYINTSGIGIIPDGINIGGAMAEAGDAIIVSGPVGNHGAAIITAREELGFKTNVCSDAAPLNRMIESMLNVKSEIHAMRDATRGGLATVLNEIAIQSKIRIEINETDIPIENEVRGVCELLGLDPYYMANEGRIVVFVKENYADQMVTEMRKSPYGKGASVIGRVVDKDCKPMVILKTTGRGSRTLDILAGEPLPRIC